MDRNGLIMQKRNSLMPEDGALLPVAFFGAELDDIFDDEAPADETTINASEVNGTNSGAASSQQQQQQQNKPQQQLNNNRFGINQAIFMSGMDSRLGNRRRRSSAEIEDAEKGLPPPSWQNEAADKPHRESMVRDVTKLLTSRKKSPPSKEWTQQLPHKVRVLEDRLYNKASSLEAYLDRTTLKHRLRKLAVSITKFYKASPSRFKSSSFTSVGSSSSVPSSTSLSRSQSQSLAPSVPLSSAYESSTGSSATLTNLRRAASEPIVQRKSKSGNSVRFNVGPSSDSSADNNEVAGGIRSGRDEGAGADADAVRSLDSNSNDVPAPNTNTGADADISKKSTGEVINIVDDADTASTTGTDSAIGGTGAGSDIGAGAGTGAGGNASSDNVNVAMGQNSMQRPVSRSNSASSNFQGLPGSDMAISDLEAQRAVNQQLQNQIFETIQRQQQKQQELMSTRSSFGSVGSNGVGTNNAMQGNQFAMNQFNNMQGNQFMNMQQGNNNMGMGGIDSSMQNPSLFAAAQSMLNGGVNNNNNNNNMRNSFNNTSMSQNFSANDNGFGNGSQVLPFGNNMMGNNNNNNQGMLNSNQSQLLSLQASLSNIDTCDGNGGGFNPNMGPPSNFPGATLTSSNWDGGGGGLDDNPSPLFPNSFNW